jgi:hypothetical protein
MALAFEVIALDPIPGSGGKRERIVNITFDNSYPTGGEAVTPANFKLNGIDTIECMGGNAASCANRWPWDAENGKIMAFDAAGQVANATDLSTHIPKFRVTGY